jgi:hypothetical protein
MSDADNERTNREPKMIQSQSMAGESGSAKKASSATAVCWPVTNPFPARSMNCLRPTASRGRIMQN